MILRRVWQRTFVLGHLSKIAAVDPPAEGWATDEVIGLTLGWIAKTLAQELPTRKLIICTVACRPARFFMRIIAQSSLVNLLS